MLQIELQTLPKKGQPASTYCSFEISADTTVTDFVAIASEKAGTEIRLDGPNVVRGLRKFKLTGEPDQLIREALSLPPLPAKETLDDALAHDIGMRYVAELKAYVSICNTSRLSKQDGPGEWSIAGLSEEAEDESAAFLHADGSWDKQALVNALLTGAACAGDAAGVHAALRRGAQIDSQPYSAAGTGTALHVALDGEIAAILLDAGADVNARDGTGGGLPLTRAIRFGRIETAKVLIQRGALVEFTLSGEPDSALRFVHMAAYLDPAQKAELARLIIAHHADVNHQDRSGWSVLMEAAIHNNELVARMLIEAGADINAVGRGPNDWGDVTALDVAQKNGFTALAAELESRGARASSDLS